MSPPPCRSCNKFLCTKMRHPLMECGRDENAHLCEICFNPECMRSNFPFCECRTLTKSDYDASDSEGELLIHPEDTNKRYKRFL